MAVSLIDKKASQWCGSRDSEHTQVSKERGREGERAGGRERGRASSNEKDNTEPKGEESYKRGRLLHHPASQTLRYVLLLNHTREWN